jgi:6-phosphofructokinase 1
MKVGVLTSGGDSPGMNACVRAIVRIGINRGLQIVGIYGGYQGILDKQFNELNPRSVSNIIHRGGTFLTTGRSKEYQSPGGVEKAARILKEHEFDALIAIGGDGTMHGLDALEKHWDGIILGLPGTIDNDLYGTDYTIGFHTAVANAVDAVDKIRDTADAFGRFFLVEVMGRDAGFIAEYVGIACGAESILIPETPTNLDAIASDVIEARKKGKKSSIIIVAEGDEAGDAATIASKLSKQVQEHCRVSVLGYIQRGGNSTHQDRILATRLGAWAVECVLEDKHGVMVGEVNGELTLTPFKDTWEKKKPLDTWMLSLVEELAT